MSKFLLFAVMAALVLTNSFKSPPLSYNYFNFFDNKLLAALIAESTHCKPKFIVWTFNKVYILYHIPGSGWLQKFKTNSHTVIFLQSWKGLCAKHHILS